MSRAKFSSYKTKYPLPMAKNKNYVKKGCDVRTSFRYSIGGKKPRTPGNKKISFRKCKLN